MSKGLKDKKGQCSLFPRPYALRSHKKRPSEQLAPTPQKINYETVIWP